MWAVTAMVDAVAKPLLPALHNNMASQLGLTSQAHLQLRWLGNRVLPSGPSSVGLPPPCSSSFSLAGPSLALGMIMMVWGMIAPQHRQCQRPQMATQSRKPADLEYLPVTSYSYKKEKESLFFKLLILGGQWSLCLLEPALYLHNPESENLLKFGALRTSLASS